MLDRSMKHTAHEIQFVAPADAPMAGQMVGIELMLALAVARVVKARPKLLPALRRMQEASR
jgi:hypothetical protein